MKIIATHNGSFHADDVFAVAATQLAFPLEEFKVLRTRDKEEIEKADFVIDVGLVYDPSSRRFDHHQPEGAGQRENGIPYASFGLVWKEYGLQISGSAVVAEKIEEKLVIFVDAIDNGKDLTKPLYENIRPYTISDYLYSFWIDENSNEAEADLVFDRVVGMAKDLLKREVDKAARIVEESKEVFRVYQETEDKRIIVLDEHLPWGTVLMEHPEPLIAVYPRLDGKTWCAKGVNKSHNSFERRVFFPESWAAKTDKELQEVSGVADALFCHKGRFLAVAGSKEGAIALAKLAIAS